MSNGGPRQFRRRSPFSQAGGSSPDASLAIASAFVIPGLKSDRDPLQSRALGEQCFLDHYGIVSEGGVVGQFETGLTPVPDYMILKFLQGYFTHLKGVPRKPVTIYGRLGSAFKLIDGVRIEPDSREVLVNKTALLRTR